MNNQTSQNTFKDKRDQFLVEIRKSKAEEFVKKSRQRFISQLADQDDKQISQLPPEEAIKLLNQSAGNFLQAIQENSLSGALTYATLIRKVVCKEGAPIAELFQTGVLVPMMKLIEQIDEEKLPLIRELMNIMAAASGGNQEQVDVLVDMGILSKFLRLIECKDESVKDDAVFSLANIIVESPKYKDFLIENSVASILTDAIDEKSCGVDFINHCCWFISNLCAKPYPKFEDICAFLCVLDKTIMIDHDDILHYTLWTLSYISDGDDSEIEEVMGMDVLERLFKLCLHTNYDVAVPAVRTVAHLTGTSDDRMSSILINHGVLDALAVLLDSGKKVIRKEAVWSISNLAASNYEIVEAIFDYKDRHIIKRLFEMLKGDEYGVKRECILALTNIPYQSSLEHIKILMEYDYFSWIQNILAENNDEKVLLNTLEAIESILDNAKNTHNYEYKENPYILKMEQCGVLVVIESLQHHKNDKIFSIIKRIIDNHLAFVE